MSVKELYAKEIEVLSRDERRELASLIVQGLAEAEAPVKRRRISELRGLGAEIWEGTDAQGYVNELRKEWDREA